LEQTFLSVTTLSCPIRCIISTTSENKIKIRVYRNFKGNRRIFIGLLMYKIRGSLKKVGRNYGKSPYTENLGTLI
jgi:hypothetical protein